MGWDYGDVLERVLDTARHDDFEGSSKHDALNARWLEKLAGTSRPRRLVATQLVMRSPVDVRNLVGVRKARNAKGLSLFSRALLSRFRVTGDERYATEARAPARLADRPPVGRTSPPAADRLPGTRLGVPVPVAGRRVLRAAELPEPGRDRRTSARRCSTRTRRSVTSATSTRPRTSCSFLLDAPKTLFVDDRHRCVSYVPDEAVTWIVMDVSVLVGALAARLGALRDDAATA